MVGRWWCCIGQMINWSTIWNYTNTQIHILLQIQKQIPTPNTVKVGQREGWLYKNPVLAVGVIINSSTVLPTNTDTERNTKTQIQGDCTTLWGEHTLSVLNWVWNGQLSIPREAIWLLSSDATRENTNTSCDMKMKHGWIWINMKRCVVVRRRRNTRWEGQGRSQSTPSWINPPCLVLWSKREKRQINRRNTSCYIVPLLYWKKLLFTPTLWRS